MKLNWLPLMRSRWIYFYAPVKITWPIPYGTFILPILGYDYHTTIGMNLTICFNLTYKTVKLAHGSVQRSHTVVPNQYLLNQLSLGLLAQAMYA